MSECAFEEDEGFIEEPVVCLAEILGETPVDECDEPFGGGVEEGDRDVESDDENINEDGTVVVIFPVDSEEESEEEESISGDLVLPDGPVIDPSDEPEQPGTLSDLDDDEIVAESDTNFTDDEDDNGDDGNIDAMEGDDDDDDHPRPDPDPDDERPSQRPRPDDVVVVVADGDLLEPGVPAEWVSGVVTVPRPVPDSDPDDEEEDEHEFDNDEFEDVTDVVVVPGILHPDDPIWTTDGDILVVGQPPIHAGGIVTVTRPDPDEPSDPEVEDILDSIGDELGEDEEDGWIDIPWVDIPNDVIIGQPPPIQPTPEEPAFFEFDPVVDPVVDPEPIQIPVDSQLELTSCDDDYNVCLALWNRINAYRLSLGLNHLRMDPRLTAAAKFLANSNAVKTRVTGVRVLSHEDDLFQNVPGNPYEAHVLRAQRFGYRSTYVVENIHNIIDQMGTAEQSADQFFDAWRHETGQFTPPDDYHNQNMKNDKIVEGGVGCYCGSVVFVAGKQTPNQRDEIEKRIEDEDILDNNTLATQIETAKEAFTAQETERVTIAEENRLVDPPRQQQITGIIEDGDMSFMDVEITGSRIVIIADKSGSMSEKGGVPWLRVKGEILNTVARMPETTRLKIILFNDLDTIPYPLGDNVWAHPNDWSAIQTWLNSNVAIGGTRPDDAIRKLANLTPYADTVFLMSDGRFDTHIPNVVRRIWGETGMPPWHTITFMNTVGASMMSQISSDTGGTYHHVAL